MDVLHIEQLLYYPRYLLSSLELYVRYKRQVMVPNMHRNHFAISRFVRIRDRCEIRRASYAAEQASHSLSDKPFLRMQCFLDA